MSSRFMVRERQRSTLLSGKGQKLTLSLFVVRLQRSAPILSTDKRACPVGADACELQVLYLYSECPAFARAGTWCRPTGAAVLRIRSCPLRKWRSVKPFCARDRPFREPPWRGSRHFLRGRGTTSGYAKATLRGLHPPLPGRRADRCKNKQIDGIIRQYSQNFIYNYTLLILLC